MKNDFKNKKILRAARFELARLASVDLKATAFYLGCQFKVFPTKVDVRLQPLGHTRGKRRLRASLVYIICFNHL